MTRGLPRDLHPGAWWLWAIGLAAAASQTVNPFLLLLLVAVVSLVVASRRTDAPWALSFRFYLWFGLFVVVMRVLFRVVFGAAPVEGDLVLLSLPEVPLPEAARGITLLGDVTREELLSGLYDGMRLAAIIICVGAANTLADPKRLLKSVPSAFYEVGTAIVVALSVFPQLVESVQRVHRARTLRGDPGRGVGRLRRVAVPVLEDALERSLVLAAGMDARGYGRTGLATASERRRTGVLMLLGLFGLAVGAYGFLDATAPRWSAWPLLGAGVALSALALWSAGRRVERTRYRPDSWRRPAELVTMASGVAAAVAVGAAVDLDPYVAYPGLSELPTVPVAALAAIALGALPAVLTPPPVSAATPAPPVEVPA